MQQRPVIGIPMQTLQAIDRIPEDLPMSWVMNQRYILTLTSVGAIPWMIPLLCEDVGTLRAAYEHLDGVFIAGGVDMDPATYGEEMTPLCGRIDPPRDQTELALTRWAMEDGKPVLGVCRGLQVINVAAGGTLYQDLAVEYPGAIKHDYYPGAGHARDYLAHEVRIEGRSRLHRSFGAEQIRVNSMHHQAIKTLGEGLVGTAWAPDGVIEAAESAEHPFVAGAQWHPEMLADTDAPTLRLFTAFAEASMAFHEGRKIAGPVAA